MLYNQSMLNVIKDHLLMKKETISVAESVTSGHLQAALSAAKEASLIFQGGITVYNLGQKTRHLNIEPIYAEQCSCISQEIASQMALMSNQLFLSDYGIGITGYASKMPDKGVTQLFAFYSIAYYTQIIRSGKIESNEEQSVDVQIDYTNQVIEQLLNLLQQNHESK